MALRIDWDRTSALFGLGQICAIAGVPKAIKARPVWSWDITKIKTTAKWTYFYLYVLLDEVMDIQESANFQAG